MKKQELIKFNLPDSPGVYIFKDEEDKILYIGKATSIKNRVKSYFAKDLDKTRGLKIVNMILLAKKVEYKVTNSVLEALLLENILIKKYKPAFNTKDKDDKSYSCVVITKEDYPRVLLMRVRDYEKRFVKDKTLEKVDKVYGPFTNTSQIKEAMRIIRKIFPYRDNCEIGQEKECFNASIKLCPGVCVKKINKVEYKQIIKNIKNLFEGKREQIIKDLQKQMQSYIKKLEFEKAKKIRDTIWAFEHIKDVALIKNDELLDFKNKDFRIEAYDVAHISGSERVGVMVVVEGGKKIKSEYRKFKLEENKNDDYAGIKELLRRRFKHLEWRLPDLIVFDGGEGQKRAGEQAMLEAGFNIPTCAVVKDKNHKAREIITNYPQLKKYDKEIILANIEAHRFAISYHKLLRNKTFLQNKKS